MRRGVVALPAARWELILASPGAPEKGVVFFKFFKFFKFFNPHGEAKSLNFHWLESSRVKKQLHFEGPRRHNNTRKRKENQ